MKRFLLVWFLLILLCPLISFGADTKVSGLTELSAIPASGDLFMCVDVSDTTMAASGTNKKITYANLLGYETVGVVGDIQTAIDRAEAAVGGIVHLKCGTYTLTSGLTLEANNVILEGSGSCTVLKAGDASNIDVITVGGAQSKRWAIRNLLIDGNKANQTTGGYGINVIPTGTQWDSEAQIEHIRIINTVKDGLRSGTTTMTELRLVDVYVEGSDANGFGLFSPDMKIINCVAGNNKKFGFELGSGNAQVVNTKAYGSDYLGWSATNYSNFYISNHRVQLTGCQAQDGWTDGFNIQADNVSLIGCQAQNNGNGGTVAGTWTGIRLSNIADKATIVGNRSLGTNQDYGMMVVDGGTDNYAIGNNLVGNIASISMSATALAANNIITDVGIVDARIDDAINSGDATTDGVIDAIRDALITIGLIKVE